jgi:glycyl-tRNA synthetase (class II)
MQDDTVTVRHRDTMQQERVKASELGQYMKHALEAARN